MTRSVFNNFTYDAHGNLTGYTANYGTNHPLNGVYSFDYDEKDQLTQESSTRQGAPTYDYTYDAAGNPTEFRNVALDEANEDNQDPNNVYDGNGNPTTYHGETLTYDSQNHLLAKDGVTFGYGADGRRAWKQVGETRTYFLYEGNNPVCEVQLIDGHTVVTALNVFSNGELVSRTEYTYDESGTPIGAETTLYQFDALGNVGHRLDDDGNLLTTQLYDAYGTALAAYDPDGEADPETIIDPYGYKGSVGYYTDHETGLILCTHRYYDAEVGRWLTRDPIGYQGGLNLYQYCGNNPANVVDTMGEAPKWLINWLAGPGSQWVEDSLYTIGYGDWFDKLTSFFSGWGDTLTYGWATDSTGVISGTEAIRKIFGLDDSVDTSNTAYEGGKVVGIINIAFIAYAAIIECGVAMGEYVTVTHWDTAARIAEISAKGLHSGAWVMLGRPNILNYVFSGVAQQRYAYGSYVVLQVLRSSLVSPLASPDWKDRALFILKHLIGQRIYKP